MIKNNLKIIIIICFGLIFVAWLDPFRDEVSKGNGQFNDKKFKEAKESYKKAEKYAPGKKDEQKLHFNKGNADYMMGEYDNAIINYQKSIQSGDKEVQKKAFFNMGNAYIKQGKYKEAINAFINALKIDPNYKNAKKNIEYLLKNKQDKKDKDKKDDKNKDKQDKQDKDKKDKQEKEKDKQKDKKKQNQRKMSKDQIKNILKSMKQKPVKRKKGDSNENHSIEKKW